MPSDKLTGSENDLSEWSCKLHVDGAYGAAGKWGKYFRAIP
jgi:hypothetical protein